MSRPLVKICGVTDEAEVRNLLRCGADFFGLVVDVPSPWTITAERAKCLAALAGKSIRPTLVSGPNHPQRLVELVTAIGARAIQLGAASLPEHVRHLRGTFAPDELTILQVISYRSGGFWKEERVGDYLAAGADYLLLDTLKTPGSPGASAPIPEQDLRAFRERHAGAPLLIAGGISAGNVRAAIAASGAAGIDVCSSVRRDGRIRADLVQQLIAQFESD